MTCDSPEARVDRRAVAIGPAATLRAAFAAAVVLLCHFLPGLAAAQSFPSKPVHIIVPFAPGGAFDVLARVIASHLEPQWHQPVLVETKPGAGSVVGTTVVARANPDGYTLVLVANSLVINAKLRPTLRTISIRLPEAMIAELKRLANKRDVPYQSLVKVFLAERVKAELAQTKPPSRSP